MLSQFSVIGDPHCTPKSLDKIKRLFLTIEETGLPTIILGDLFDTKEVLRGSCLNLVYNSLKQSKLQFIVLVGNHDLFRLDQPQHSLEVLKELKNVTIIDSIRQHPALPFVFFPYIHDKSKLKEELQKYSGKDLIAFGHFDVSGFDYGNGYFCEDGVITHDDFKGFKRVISGHFHKLQQTGNFTYIGTPFSHSFGEANQDKVIGVYHLDEDRLELIPTDFPRHISTKIDMSKKNGQKKLEEFIAGHDNDLVRIQLHGAPEDVAKIDKSLYQNYSIKWEDKSDAPTGTNANLDETLDNRGQFLEWSKNIKNLDKDTVQLGMSILEAVGAK